MLIPIKHENMTARRWPVVTLALIAINVLVFLFTTSAINDEQAAAASPVPHLDWEQHIQAGIKEAKLALAGGRTMSASAQ